MDVVIRSVAPGDYQYISVLSRELGYEFPLEKVESRIRYITENTKDIILVAEINGEVAGYIHASPYELMFSEPIMNIVAFVVNTTYRGTGIGHRLLAQMERLAQENKFTMIRLTSAMHRTHAHQFYDAHGYTGCDVKFFKKALSD